MIKYFITDCDGVLTDGKYYYSSEGKQLVTFHANDSVAMDRLKDLGIRVIIVSSGSYQAINIRRAEDLNIERVYAPFGEKLQTVLSLGVDLDEAVYIGDCTDDIPLLSSVFVSFVPRNALPIVKQSAKFILNRNSGEGCILEILFKLEELLLI